MDDGSFESRPSKRLSRSPALNFRARCPSAADFANDSSRHVAARRNARRRAAALGVRLRFRYSPVVSPTFERTFRDARISHATVRDGLPPRRRWFHPPTRATSCARSLDRAGYIPQPPYMETEPHTETQHAHTHTMGRASYTAVVVGAGALAL